MSGPTARVVRSQFTAVAVSRSLLLPPVLAVASAPAVALLIAGTAGTGPDSSIATAAAGGILVPLLVWAVWGSILGGAEYARGGLSMLVPLAGTRGRLMAAMAIVAAVIGALGSALGTALSLAAITLAAPGNRGTFGSLTALFAIPVTTAAVAVVGVALGVAARSAIAGAAIGVAALAAPKAAGGLLGVGQPWIVGASPATVIANLVRGGAISGVERFPWGPAAALAIVVAVAVAGYVMAHALFTRHDV